MTALHSAKVTTAIVQKTLKIRAARISGSRQAAPPNALLSKTDSQAAKQAAPPAVLLPHGLTGGQAGSHSSSVAAKKTREEQSIRRLTAWSMACVLENARGRASDGFPMPWACAPRHVLGPTKQAEPNPNIKQRLLIQRLCLRLGYPQPASPICIAFACGSATVPNFGANLVALGDERLGGRHYSAATTCSAAPRCALW